MVDTSMIPHIVSEYNVYLNGEKMVGVSDDTTLPTVKSKTTDVEGVGILGAINHPALGEFESMEQEIGFNLIQSHFADMMAVGKHVQLTFRAAQQLLNKSLGIQHIGLRIVEEGEVKEFTPGKIKKGEGMDAKAKIEVTYLLIESNGEALIEIDKLNGVYRVKGADQLADVSALI